MDLFGGGAALVFGHRACIENRQANALLVQFIINIIIKIGAKQLFGERRFLGHEEPVIGFKPPAKAYIGQGMIGRHDVKRSQPPDPLRRVQRHAERHARATIMARHLELLEIQNDHFQIILRHGAETVARVILAAIRLGTVPITAQIRQNHREIFCEHRGHAMPADMGKRIAVQQKQRRTRAAYRNIYLGARCLDPPITEAWQQRRRILF